MVCTMDGRCKMCTFARARGKTAEELVDTSEEWRDLESPDEWGPKDLESWRFVKFGLLDTVEDPEAPAEEQEEAAGQAGGSLAGGEASGSGVGQTRSGHDATGAPSGNDEDYVVLEDSAHEGAALVYASMSEDQPVISRDDPEAMDLESDGASWQVVYRGPYVP